MIRRRPALRADRRDEDELTDAGARRRMGELSGCLMVDAIVEARAGAAAVGDAGKVDDLIDAFEQRPPIKRLCQIRMLYDLDTGAERQVRPPHGGAHVMAGVRQRLDGGAADKARGAGD